MKLWRPLYWPVMWSETIGHRTRPGLGLTHGGLGLDLGQLVLQIWCCVMKHALVTLIVTVILNDTATFQFQVGLLFIVSRFCASNITTVEINSGVYLFKS